MSDQREDFEEAAARMGYNLTMTGVEIGEYHHSATQDAWEMWQECCDKARAQGEHWAGTDAQEIETLREMVEQRDSEIERLRGRESALESFIFKPCRVNQNAWILRKQAEAINQSINNYFNIDNGPHGLKDHLEWQAQRLHAQAEAAEKGGDDA